jgi:hypothetical protein
VGVSGTTDPAQTAGEYCRAIEAYLCRENGGHLVRIVGPAFQVVAGWHAAGIPFAIVKQGVDRTLARDRAKPAGPARRPVRVEFCDADVQDAFAAWKRAVGVGMAGSGPDAGEAGDESAQGQAAASGPAESAAASRSSRRPSLAAHVDRAMQRLTQALLDLARFGPEEAAAVRVAMEAALGTLDRLQADARGARGEARAAIQATLAAADDALAAALIASLPAPVATDLSRTAPERAALARLVRERYRAPELTARAGSPS